MKLTIAKDQLSLGLQAVQNIVGSRTTLPILSNVLLRAADNKLELTATDLDVTITCVVEAQVVKAGASTVPVKKLFSIVRELGVPEAELEVDDKNACSLRAGSDVVQEIGRFRQLGRRADLEGPYPHHQVPHERHEPARHEPGEPGPEEAHECPGEGHGVPVEIVLEQSDVETLVGSYQQNLDERHRGDNQTAGESDGRPQRAFVNGRKGQHE